MLHDDRSRMQSRASEDRLRERLAQLRDRRANETRPEERARLDTLIAATRDELKSLVAPKQWTLGVRQ